MGLPIGSRVAIAAQFGIAKTGSTHVVGDRIQDDGYKIQDIDNALTSEAMKEFLGVEHADHEALFDLLIAKFEKGVTPIPDESPTIPSNDPVPPLESPEPAPKKLGRKPKTV